MSKLKRPKRSDFGTKQDIQYQKSLNKYIDQLESKLKEAEEGEIKIFDIGFRYCKNDKGMSPNEYLDNELKKQTRR